LDGLIKDYTISDRVSTDALLNPIVLGYGLSMGWFADRKKKNASWRIEAIERIMLESQIKTAQANGQKLLMGAELAEHKLRQRYLSDRNNQECVEKAKLWVSLSHAELIVHMDNETPNYRKHAPAVEIINETDDSIRHALIVSYWKNYETEPSRYLPELLPENHPTWDGYNQWRRENPS
jgi:hypothetical protein